MDPDYAKFTASLQSASARSSSTAVHESGAVSGTASQAGLADVLLNPLFDTYRHGTEMVQTNVVDPLNYLYSHMTADNAAGIVQTHVVDPMNQAYKHMSHNATDLVHRHVVTSVKQAPAYVQSTVVHPIMNAYDENVAKPTAKAAGSFTNFLKKYGLWQEDDQDARKGREHKGEEHKGGHEGAHKDEHKGEDNKGGDPKGEEHKAGDYKGGEQKGGEHKGAEHKGEEHKAGDLKGGERKGDNLQRRRLLVCMYRAVASQYMGGIGYKALSEERIQQVHYLGAKEPVQYKSATELPLKPALKRRDSLTIALKRASDHGGDARKSPDRPAEGKGGGETGPKVKFGREEVHTLPPEKKRDKYDFNEFLEDQLGKIVTTSRKESKELLDTMMKEAMEATGKEEKKKPEHMATEEPHHKKTTGKATGKSVAEWVATPEEKHEYRKFQDMLQSKAMHDHTKGHEDSAVKHHEGPGKQEAPQHPPHGAIAKHHEEAHKPGDNKQGGKEDAHKKLETEAHKPEKDRGLHGDKTGRAKPEAKPGEKPHGVAAAPTAGLTGEPAGQGPVLEGAAAPVAKSSSWWKSLRHFFRRKPEDEESSGEEGFRYREMDEEFIECAGDQGAAGEAAQESHKDGAAVVAADAATGPKQYKLNACLLVSSGAVIFVVLLAVLLSGDLFDDLDNSVPTFEIDLGKVVNVLDDVGFLGAGMNSSIMGKPGSWRPLLERPANDSLVLLLKGLAPAVLRFAGRETDHFYFVEGEKDGNSSRGGTDEGGLASRGNLS
ncbi:hypothetical protein MRX96_018091 [Rhipicephalus microplus]